MEKKYESHVLKLLTTPGYVSWYLNCLPDYADFTNPGKKAWEATERAYYRYFEVSKYTSYESFKSALSRFNKAKQKNKTN